MTKYFCTEKRKHCNYSFFISTLPKKDVSSSSGKSTTSSSMKLAGVKLRLWALLRVLSRNERPWGDKKVRNVDLQHQTANKMWQRDNVYSPVHYSVTFPAIKSPWPRLRQPWSSSWQQIPSSSAGAACWDLSGSWWKNRGRQLREWWGFEARCTHPPPPPYGKLALVPGDPQSGEQWDFETQVKSM